MIGGALGAALETEDAVHDAAYVRRSDAQTEEGNGLDSAGDAVPQSRRLPAAPMSGQG